MTPTELKVREVIDRARHRRELQELVGATEPVTRLIRRVADPELVERMLALPTATEFENARRTEILRNAKTRDEAEEKIGIPRRSFYTWIHRREETKELWNALPLRPKGPAGCPQKLAERRIPIIAACATLAEAADRLRISQQALDHWLHANNLHAEASRLRAAQNAQMKAKKSDADINIHFGPIVRDPAIWRKAVSRMPADLRWYLGPEPVKEQAA